MQMNIDTPRPRLRPSVRRIAFAAVAALLAGGLSTIAPTSGEAAPVPARIPLCLTVPGGSAGDVAVINITNTDATGPGYGALRASDADPIPWRPASGQYASVNFAPGEPDPNLAVVTIGTDGRVCYDSDGGATHVILDLLAIIPTANVNAIEPLRLRDTRRSGGRVAPRTPLCLTLPTRAAAPGDVAVVNITNTDATGVGYGALRASNADPIPSRPATDQYSSVSFAPGRIDPNLAFVTAGTDGGICYDSDGGAAHVILDLVAVIPADKIDSVEAQRLIDTRPRGRRIAAQSPLCVSVPDGTPGDAAVINITNTDATGSGYGALRASQAQPVPSRATARQFASVNFAAGVTNPNLAVVTIGTDGRVCYDSYGGATHVILDLVAIIPGANLIATEPTRIRDTRGEPDPATPCENPPESGVKITVETDLPMSSPYITLAVCGIHAAAAALPDGPTETLLVAYSDVELLAQRFAEISGSPVEQVRGWLATGGAISFSDNAIFFNVDNFIKWGLGEGFMFNVGAHEWYHNYTAHHFYRGGLPEPMTKMLLEEPVWMLEATAQWFGSEQASIYGYAAGEQFQREQGAEYQAPRFTDLKEWETNEGLQSYQLLPFIGDLLVAESSRTAFLRTYWEARAVTTEPWQTTFAEVFGIDVPTFYAKVKQHMIDIAP
jgi:hypothetical protein